MNKNLEGTENKGFLEQENGNKYEVKAFKKRWLILLIFAYYACVNSIQWIEYCSITHIVVKYYGVSTLTVDWTSIIYMALYPPLVIPVSMIIDKKGLRTAALIGCIGTLIGTSIKVFSIRSDLFPVVLAGQAIVSASQLSILCLPPKIAAVWFKPNEVSTACSLGVIGTQLGCAIGYVIPPIIVKNTDNLDEIGEGLKILCWLLTASMIPATVAVIFFFPNEPPLPPSIAQAHVREIKQEFNTKLFFKSVKKLYTNKAFFIHMVAYGINVAVFSAVGTLLTQFILQYFEDAHEDAGRMGFVMVIAGMIGSALFGILLDKTHKYNTFTNAYMPVGFELAMELTFPSEETTTTGILFSMSQLLGVIFTVAVGHLNIWLGSYWSLASQAALLFIGTVITAFIPNKLLRQEAFKDTKNSDFGRRASYKGSKLLFIE